MRRAAISLAIWGIPLTLFPPWVHNEPVDRAFWTHTFGEFDRHAPRWRPPFAEEVARNSSLRSPVVIDVPRLARELLVSAAITFWALSLVVEAFGAGARAGLLRIALPKLAALAALLLPIPPTGPLTFTSWESLTDWNHGIPFLLRTLSTGLFLHLVLTSSFGSCDPL